MASSKYKLKKSPKTCLYKMMYKLIIDHLKLRP